MSQAQPAIAITGRGCVLPGALSPQALWDAVIHRRDLTRPMTHLDLEMTPDEALAGGFRGGAIDGFGPCLEALQGEFPDLALETLDPVFTWTLQAAREAVREAGGLWAKPKRTGLILANLSYPTRGKIRLAGAYAQTGAFEGDLRNAFNSGAPARFVADALGIKGTAFSLDAACASSLYALHLASLKLRLGELDQVVVCAVNAADQVLLHTGFEALGALSPSRASQPFGKGADGLLPSQGTAAVVLSRASDVDRAAGCFGLIRGSGLSNDGRRRGFVAPDADGQAEAMARAYQASGLTPENIDLLECHATGTPVGDRVEIESSARIFAGKAALPIGSLKSNTGHLITVAGLASLLKLLSAFEHERMPPTRLIGEASNAFEGTGLFALREAREWAAGKGARRLAAISNFGFGGNNAHLIVEAPDALDQMGDVPAELIRQDNQALRLVACEGLAGNDFGFDRILRRAMNSPEHKDGSCDRLHLSARYALTPPDDLKAAEPNQLAVLALCEALQAQIDIPDDERVGVFVGTECGFEATRFMLRDGLAAAFGRGADDPDIQRVRDAISPAMAPRDVLGAMPNMPANRVNHAGDFRGFGLTVSAGKATGETSLSLAKGALAAGEIDLAIVAAVDFASEPRRSAALKQGGEIQRAADLGCVLALRLDDGCSEGELFDEKLAKKTRSASLTQALYGDAPVAGALFAHGLAHRMAQRNLTSDGRAAFPSVTRKKKAIARATASPDMLRELPYFYYAAGKDRNDLVERMMLAKRGGSGPCRIAVLARTAEELEAKKEDAMMQMAINNQPDVDGLYYGETAPQGELAFVYTGAASAYPRMGRGLLMAFPKLAQKLAKRFPDASELAPLFSRRNLSAYEQLCGVTLVSQAHTLALRDMLGIEPDVVMGLSLGESNAMIGFDVWSDAGTMLKQIKAAGLYDKHLGGECDVARRAWGSEEPVAWENWRVYAKREQITALVEQEEHVEFNIAYTDEDFVIGGPPEACRRIAHKLGPTACRPLPQHLIVHAKAFVPYAEEWRKLHSRKVKKPSFEVRFYANAINDAFHPTRDSIADMLTQQASEMIDFPATIRKAYEDGVRTFIELGPRDSLTQSIGKILGDQPHLALAMDRIETSDIEQVAQVAAQLFAAGYDVDMAPVAEALDQARAHGWAFSLAAPSGLEFEICRDNHQDAYTGLARTVPCGVGPYTGPLVVRAPRGPVFEHGAIEAATHGPVSALFGEAFFRQDGFRRQVRLPMPPLLLVDRIKGIDAEPGVAGAGTIWTETRIEAEAWYCHHGRIRPGPLIEAGQADLSLISWMGADFDNQDERVYRLLGCEITFHEAGLPRAGETLNYQIEITGHAKLNAVRMFFFQYDCYVGDRLVFSVRNGQAGFFSDEELASGGGVLWDAAEAGPPTLHVEAFEPKFVSSRRAFSKEELAAYRAGDTLACFGAGFEASAAQSRPAALPDGKLALIDEVTVFEPQGGPWKRGYLKAVSAVPKDEWFYDGHFHEDPCMPGTLMAEAGVQALEFFAGAIGLTVERDGMIFEPVPGETAKFLCRGQVVPDRDHLVEYEIFIDQVVDGETPEIYAAILATCEGKKVFYCPRFGVRLRRNWPLPSPDILPEPIGPMGESRGDWAALQACGNGAPSDAFGDMYRPFDEAGWAPRLPQAPYHMISKVVSVSTRPNAPEIGATVVCEYHVQPRDWYFKANRNAKMPFAVLLEVALQPCGWLASHGGFALNGGELFRNLDGDGEVLRDVGPDVGKLVTRSVMTNFSRAGATTIVFFDVEVTTEAGDVVMAFSTSFGFFPKATMAQQVGLKRTEEETRFAMQDGAKVKVRDPSRALPTGMMKMLDHVDYFDPEGGAAGLGLARGHQAIDPHAWYFKAHFFQDPVQPGSLGLDALVQLLERAILLKQLVPDGRKTRFEALAIGCPMAWTYRGQVTPVRQRVKTLVEITEIAGRDDHITVSARGELWCDGLKIYEAKAFSVRAHFSD